MRENVLLIFFHKTYANILSSTYGGTHCIVRVVETCARYEIERYFSYRGVIYRRKCLCGKTLFDIRRFPSYGGFDFRI
jgi:hypothetical protein